MSLSKTSFITWFENIWTRLSETVKEELEPYFANMNPKRGFELYWKTLEERVKLLDGARIIIPERGIKPGDLVAGKEIFIVGPDYWCNFKLSCDYLISFRHRFEKPEQKATHRQYFYLPWDKVAEFLPLWEELTDEFSDSKVIPLLRTFSVKEEIVELS